MLLPVPCCDGISSQITTIAFKLNILDSRVKLRGQSVAYKTWICRIYLTFFLVSTYFFLHLLGPNYAWLPSKAKHRASKRKHWTSPFFRLRCNFWAPPRFQTQRPPQGRYGGPWTTFVRQKGYHLWLVPDGTGTLWWRGLGVSNLHDQVSSLESDFPIV